MKAKFILLHSDDNVVVCCQQAEADETIDVNTVKIKLIQNIDIGHKVACRPIAKGDSIIKYGVSIGSALQNIQAGEHIHLHNMKSDYIPPHTREQLQDVSEYK